MPAYTNNLRLREITTGDESGTWGDTTNSNLELIADAFGSGTEGLSGTTHTTTIADSTTASEGRAIYMKYTGALGANNTITLAPNTINKLWIIENATTDSGSSGPYSIIISQGSGDNVTIPNGKVAVVYADGAGGAADVKEAFANLKIGPSLTVGNAAAEDTKVVFDGNAQDYYVGLDDTDDDLKIGLGSTVGTTSAITIDENQDTTITQDLAVSGVGPHSFGAARVNNVRFNVAGAFTSGGVADYATGFNASAAITGAIGDTVALAGAIFQNTITTQGTNTNISRVAQVMINEPQISNNLASSGKPDVAATLWIQSAPTEGDVNAALYVADGLSHFAGNIEVAKSAAKVIVDSSSTASIDIDRSATTEGAKLNFATAGSVTWTAGMQDSDDWGDGTPFYIGTGSSAANAKFCMNTSGVITLGTVTPEALYTLTPKLQVETTGDNAGLSAWRNENGAGGPYLFLGKSRGTAVNADTIVQDDDVLGSIMFVAADGVDRGNAAASIIAYIDGTPGENDTPGRLQFNTSADGSGSPTTRMTILSTGSIGINDSNPSHKIQVVEGTVDTNVALFKYNADAAVGSLAGVKIWNSDGTVNSKGGIHFAMSRNDGVEAMGGAIYLGRDESWTSTASTRDNYMAFATSYNGTVQDSLKIAVDGSLQIRSAANAPNIQFNESDDAGKMLIKFSSDIGEFTVIPDKPVYFKNNNTTRMSIAVGGAVNVAGAFSKGSGSFRIDHPLSEKKDTHHLVHSFIEGPKADLIYRGTVDLSGGYAQVDLDDAAGMTEGTWELLCRDAQCWIQNDSGWSAVRGDVEGNTLTIECEATDSDDTVSWMVVAERCDPHIMETDWTDEDGHVIVEPVKPEPEPEEEEE